MNQHDLDKLHKQWFHPEQEKKDKVLRNEPVLIKRIQRDYDKLEDLAAERIELVEGALQLASWGWLGASSTSSALCVCAL